MLTENEIKIICSAYCIDGISIGKIIDTSKNENDLRFNYEIDGKYFLKLTNSNFLSEEILNDIAVLIENYNSIGVYCPSLIKNIEGKYSFIIKHDKYEYICYLEEKAKFNFYNECCNIDYNFRKQTIKHLGILASKYSDINLSERKSMWSVIELNAYDRDIDEKQDNLNDLTDALKLSYYGDLANKLNSLNETSRNKIKDMMPILPKCVYQGDLNESNILVDEDGNFKGIIDFNMFGTEVNINCFLNESMYYITENDFKHLSGEEIFYKAKDIQSELLLEILKIYKFNKNEREVLPYYNRIIFSSFYPNAALIIKLLKSDKFKEKVAKFLNLVCENDYIL